MKHIYIKVLLLLTLNSFSQLREGSNLPTFTPASPKSFEFLKYGEIPVSKYTGVPSISIPIYTINAKGFDIPLSLTYHSNGFMANEESGWTGLGWTLQGGGSIVQIVNGFDDFGVFRNRFLPDFAELIDIQCGGGCPSGSSIIGMCYNTMVDSDAQFNNEHLHNSGYPGYYYIPLELFFGTKDYEPDLFKFNMPGYSGEFLLDWKNEKFVCLTDSKIRVEADLYTIGQTPTDFSIMVPDGHVFTFRMKEETIIELNHTQFELNPNPMPTVDIGGKASSRSYQLITIVTNQGDRIDYNYSLTNAINNYPNISKSIVRYIARPNGMSFPNGLDQNITSKSYTKQPYSYISDITFNGGVLVFTTSDRIDNIGTKKLDKIELKRTINTSQAVKTINFGYDYFVGHSQGTNYDSYLNVNGSPIKTPTELTHRLKLASVAEAGSKPYLFEYNAEKLPKKTSFATDYWGYYNGYLENVTPFANIYGFGIQRGNPIFSLYEKNEKGSRLQYTKASVLERITYPTGGHTLFKYQLNSFNNQNFSIPHFEAFVPKIIAIHSRYDNDLGQPQKKSVLIKDGKTVFTIYSALLSTRGCTPTELYNGVANNNTYIKIEKFKQSIIPLVDGVSTSLESALFNLGIYTNPAIYQQYIEDVIYIRKPIDVEEKIFSNITYTFDKGVVIFSASGGCGTYNGIINSSQAGANIRYNEYKPIPQVATGAGLRVEEIESYTSDSKIASRKRYVYNGGKLMSPLCYYNTTNIINYDYIDEGGYKNAGGTKETLNSNSFIPARGNLIGYDNVDEYNINVNNFSNVPNTGKISEYYVNYVPSGISTTMSIAGLKEPNNGALASQTLYDENNMPIRNQINWYSISKFNCFFAMRANFTQRYRSISGNVISQYDKYEIGVFPSVANNVNLDKTLIREYFGQNVIETTKEFGLNNDGQTIYTKETGSNGDITEVRLTYPKNYVGTSSNPVASAMANSNVLSPVITKQVKVNGEIIASEEYEYYKRLGSNNSFIRPDVYSLLKQKTAKGANILENRIVFNQYDNLGNPLDISTENNTKKVSYIWGYNKTHPVAKIENMSYFAIPTSLISAIQSASDANPYVESNMIMALNALQNHPSLANAMITTYSYQPLIGVSTITDNRGYKTIYEYDSLGRLKAVKDNDGKMLSQNKYHFKP